MEGNSESGSPTIQHLDTNRTFENLTGSKLTHQKKLFGREYDFYEDGSVLVVDEENYQYHFLTKAGRERGKGLRDAAKQAIANPTDITGMKILGEGKGGFSKVYELSTKNGSVAVKATDGAMFFFKELMGEATTKSTGRDSLETIQGRSSRRKIIQ